MTKDLRRRSSYIFCALLFLAIGVPKGHGQDTPNQVDLGIEFNTDLSETLKINSVFGVSARVYLEVNSSTIPTGETIRASAKLFDPDGLPIESWEQTWSGFDFNTNGALEDSNGYADLVLFQVPWSQASKWSADAKWKVVLQVIAPSAEINLATNTVEQSFSVLLPDLSTTISSITATDPITGQQTTNFIPNTNYSVSGSITNIGLAPTQNNVLIPIRAELRKLNSISEGHYELGAVVDQQEIIASFSDSAGLLQPNASWPFEIDQLFLPPEALGDYVIVVHANPDDLPSGVIMYEQSFSNNLSVSPATEVDEDGDGTVDFYNLPSINISDAVSETGNQAILEYVTDSYAGESGTFRGLEPAFISFAVRNSGNRPVSTSDNITASVVLSKDLEFSEDDFILREFNLGGKGIGQGMLAGETINLTWFQQMPDYYEGDYYLLIRILNDSEESVDFIDSTPLISLVSEGEGVTRLLETAQIQDSPAERPSVSGSGRFVVFEKTITVSGKNLQQIYLVDLNQASPTPTLISKTYSSSLTNPAPANGSSFRPRISYDGSAVVFYSSAPDLVPGDTNNREDVFLFDVSSRTILRAVNENSDELNGRSLYPDINGDGTRIVFETDSTNIGSGQSSNHSQIYLWKFESNGSETLTKVTSGNASSYNPSIDRSGERIVFDSFATDLLNSPEYNNPLNLADNNGLRDIYLVDLGSSSIYIANLNNAGEQAMGGRSMNAMISGDGNRIVYESNAQNLIRGAGIAHIVVTEPGAGYGGLPTIEVFDTELNASGALGSGATLALAENGINALTELKPDSILIINSGHGYVSPQVRIIPDPAFPEPTFEAEAIAYLSSPEGDVYYVDVADFNGSNPTPLYSQRVSETSGGTGGNFGSRDVSISSDGASIVYATKSSNLLNDQVSRDDGKTFYNSNYILPKATATLVGGIGEIEIANSGSGYSSGNLLIEDLSGTGSGAIASYRVDNRGRVVSIEIVNPGINYNLDHTQISIPEPRGGTGFEAGTIRFPPTIGLGANRTGGGRIYKIEMSDHGTGYRIGEDTDSFADIIQFEGDGADLNEDGFPDGRLNPARIHNIDGGLYLEQRFDLDILSIGPTLLNTSLSFYDTSRSITPVTIEFSDSTDNNSVNAVTTIVISGKTKNEIRDEILAILISQFDIPTVNENTNHDLTSSAGDIKQSPVLFHQQDQSSFKFSAMSGRVISTNPSAVSVVAQSNMLIMGSGYTVATPVINQIPLIYGYSETISNTSFNLEEGIGRMASLAARDTQSDDIYLFQIDENNQTSNTRISTSSFGTPVGYLSSDDSVLSSPSNRFPAISGNGRYVFFSSDAWGNQGLGFLTSNQTPSDPSSIRDIYFRDLKTKSVPDEITTLEVLYPQSNQSHSFAPQSPIPVIADIEYDGPISRIEVVINQAINGYMEVYRGGVLQNLQSNRYTYQIRNLSSGDYSLQLVAYGSGSEILATSPIRRFSVSSFEGSLPPTVAIKVPSEFNTVTSTSVIPLDVQAEDSDGALVSVTYFIDGEANESINRIGGLSQNDQSYTTLLDLNYASKGESQGIRSIFAIAVDNSGNYVASDFFNFSFTGGSTPPSVQIKSGLMGFYPNDDDVSITLADGKLTDIQITTSTGAIGDKLTDARIELGGSGSGALVTAVVEKDITSSNYGKITAFEVENGGSGYSAEDVKIHVIPVLRVINPGIEAELEYVRGPDNEQNATFNRVDTIRLAKNPDGTLRTGSGYVVAPRLYLLPFYYTVSQWERLPLLETEQPTSGVEDFGDIEVLISSGDPTRRAVAYGGFSQAPIFISVQAEASDEVVESVSLVIDGQIFDGLSKTKPSDDGLFHFSWVPDVAQTYTISALVKDVGGNVVSTTPTIVSVEDFAGSGIALKMLGDSNYSVEDNAEITFELEASSPFGISEVEFFIDDKSVELIKTSGGTRFQATIDLGTLTLSQGEHEVSVVVRDKNGNQSGTFSQSLTNIKSRQNKKLTILPVQANAPLILSPGYKKALLTSEINSDGEIVGFDIVDEGYGYRFPPTVFLEGGGEVNPASATVILKDGVITKIEILDGGSGYDGDSIRLKILDNGEEHPEASRAVFDLTLNQSGGIEEIEVIDGGRDYSPSQRTTIVQVDYNGSVSGSGFRAGPIYTQNGLVDEVRIDEPGEYLQAPAVSLEGGGLTYSEGEAVHIRVISKSSVGVKSVTVIANEKEEKTREFGQSGGGMVELVSNDPYYDLFWVPDRNESLGFDGTDGIGDWSLKVRITDSAGISRTSSAVNLFVSPSIPPQVSLVTPEDNATYVYSPGSPVSLVAEATDEDGLVREVQFLINDLSSDANGSADYSVSIPPYLLNWYPEAKGTYRIKAIAIDNSGAGTMSAEHTITISDAYGEKPYAVWRGPEPISYDDRNQQDGFSYFSIYSYYYGGGFGGSSKNYLSDDLEWGSPVYLNVEAFDPSYLDSNGVTQEGGIAQVTFWENNPSLGGPTIIGEAMNKYNSIYSIPWTPYYIGQTYIWAEVKDLDNNLVRTEVRSFNVGTNSEKSPSIEIQSMRKSGQGNLSVRVNLHDIMYSVPSGFYYTQDPPYKDQNAFLTGDISVGLFINGVEVASIGIDRFPKYINYDAEAAYANRVKPVGDKYMNTIQSADPLFSYSYEFQGIPLEESGTFDVQAAVMSRQSNDNYRKVITSSAERLVVSESEIGNIEVPNLPPEGSLLSPRNTDLARALAELTDTNIETDPSFGQIESIFMESIGRSYDPDNLPEVTIQGGGGNGAQAKAVIKDGAIAELLILDWGANYGLDDNNGSYEWIVPMEDNNGTGFKAFVEVNNGVLAETQNFIDGVSGEIKNPGAGYDDILNKVGYVRIFDYNQGNGASGYVSKVNSAGGIEQITITDGGRDYNLDTSIIFILDEYNGIKTSGYGFESGKLALMDGVSNTYKITDSGSGYVLNPYLVPVVENEFSIWKRDSSRNEVRITEMTVDETKEYLFEEHNSNGTYIASGYPDATVYEFNSSTIQNFNPSSTEGGGNFAVSYWLDMDINSTTGSGFHARVVETGLRNGAINVVLENPGSGYLLPPQVILRGGSFITTGKENRRQPLQVTAGTQVLLLADTFDFDGNVKMVRFYANDVDLSVQTKKVLDSIQINSSGTGYTSPPEVYPEGGGPRKEAVLVATVEPIIRDKDGNVIQDNQGIDSIEIVDEGEDYFTAPNIIIKGGGGGGARATAKLVEKEEYTFAERLVSSLGRFGFEWIPTSPGTYLISLEVTDDDGDVTFIPDNAEVVVLPRQISQVPQISLISDYNGMAFTNQSTLRFTARAFDPDGKLESVQFYINGAPHGLPIESKYVNDQFQQPYSVEFSPRESGAYTVYATAMDNSGNYVMSDSVTFTTTTGSGISPAIFINRPTMSAEASYELNWDGSFKSISFTNPGFGYVEAPVIDFFGNGIGAKATATVNLNYNSPTYGQLNNLVLDSTETGIYYDEDTRIRFIGGFAPIKASGDIARVKVSRNEKKDGTFFYTTEIENRGSGYTSAPKISVVNGPPGMTAEAVIDPLVGSVLEVIITNPGDDALTPYEPVFSLIGGLNFSEILIDAVASDPDGDDTLKEVTFYVNGMLIESKGSIDNNPDGRAPYQILWSPEGPGIYELYATVEDSDGNLITSPVITREAILSKPPTVEFNPRDRAFGFLLPESIDENGSISSGNLIAGTLINNGFGYHSFPSIEFQDYRNEDGGSGASAIAILDNGQIEGITVEDSGTDYARYQKVSGIFMTGDAGDLLIGDGGDLMNELNIGQPLLIGEVDGTEPSDPDEVYYLDSFQSQTEIILDRNLVGGDPDKNYSLFTYGTKVLVKGGMDTAAEPLRIQFGKELSLGIFAQDPEGDAIRGDNFTVFVNGAPDSSAKIEGFGPFYRVVWNPPDLGDYKLRVQVIDPDGVTGSSQPLDIRVGAGFEPTIHMVSPINEKVNYSLGGKVRQDTFAFPSTATFTFEARDFDGTINQVTFYANSEPIGSWPNLADENSTGTWREGETDRYSVSFQPDYAGTFSISASAEDNSGQSNFSEIFLIDFVAPYRQGSLSPVAEIRYPQSNYELEGEGESASIAFPPTRVTPYLTSTSTLPITAKAFDQDGSLESLNYFVDGQLLPAYTGYLQILEKPQHNDTFILSDSFETEYFIFKEEGKTSANPGSFIEISVSPNFELADTIRENLKILQSEESNLTNVQEEETLRALSELGINRFAVPAPSLLEEILIGLDATIIDGQRVETLRKIQENLPSQISAELIGMNGVYFRHSDPAIIDSQNGINIPEITASSSSVQVKDFSPGFVRYPSRDAENYHFTQLWSPPRPGVFTIAATASDSSGNLVMSNPVTLTATLGTTLPVVELTSPISGTQRSVTQIGSHAIGKARNEWAGGLFYAYNTGRIAGVELLDRGAGYVAPPEVEFFGSGFGAKAVATIVDEPSHPRFGQIKEIEILDKGNGYYGTTVVEFRGGLGQEAVFLNASAFDLDGEIKSVEFLSNGNVISNDLTPPYTMQDTFPVGYYEFIAIAKDDAGNMASSQPARLNIATTQGAAPSGMIINPLPPMGEELTSMGQGYFWEFVRAYASEIEDAESRLETFGETHDITANSYIHLAARATDSDGNVTDVSFYLNNKLLGRAEKIHDSPHYVLPLDLSDFGEQPSYVIETVIRDTAGNLVIPNNPIKLNVLPSSGARPEIKIVVPDPKAEIAPVYPIGSPISLAVEAFPDQGSIVSVSMYANGRFIAEAMADDNASLGKGAFSLEWIPENPGKYRITSSVRDNLGTIIFTDTHVDVVVVDQAGTLPEVELISPTQDEVITLGSSMRLHSTAMERDGVFEGVQYYIDGVLQYAWSGIFDFNNRLPLDGHLLQINDGVGNSLVFEFDNDQNIASGGEFQVIAGQLRNQDNLSVGGTYTGSIEMSYYIQVDGDNTIRWSKDGGSTFVNERVSIDSDLAIGNGLTLDFSNIDKELLEFGDTWQVLAQPANTIITIQDEPAAILRTRNALARAINLATERGILEFRTEDKGTTDKLYLYSTMSLPYQQEVEVSGTALDHILYNDNNFSGSGPDNVIRRQNSFGQEFYPFGMTWEPNATGSFSLFAVARDSQTGSQVVSKSMVISVVDGTNFVPEVKLEPVADISNFTGAPTSVSLQATAFDEDGKIIEVSFYGNGVLLEVDTSSPYAASFELNASGHYEVYAVARDDDGNQVVSNVERIVVEEPGDSLGDPLLLQSSTTAYLGSVTTVDATYISPDGIYSYDKDLYASVFINGNYVGLADRYPYRRPMLWEEDSGYKFSFDFRLIGNDPKEVEFVVVDGGNTFSTSTSIQPEATPLTDDFQFLNALYNGLYDRDPEIFEISRYLNELRKGTLTRAQIVEELRLLDEFTLARDQLLIHKTLLGRWRTIATVLADQAVPVGSGAGGASSTNSANTGGTMGQNTDNNRPDDGDNSNTATVIGMNETIYGSINNVDDVDWFRIEGRGMGSDGLLNLEILSGHPGVEVIIDSLPRQKRLEVFGADSSVPTQFLEPLFAAFTGGGRGVNSRGTEANLAYSWDLSSVQETNPNYRFKIYLSPLVDEATLLNRGGQYTMVVRNDGFLQVDGAENSLFENVDSEINNYEPGQAIAHMTNKYSYTNEYGQIEEHDPETFFNRLFRNKYEQDPSPTQTARGVNLLKDLNRSTTQLQFIEDFALDNTIITTGGFNYTAELAIPNLPLDAAAFAETALVYSALIGNAPSNSDVAYLTLTPQYQLRPLSQRVELIMNMPEYGAQYGLAMPSVEIIGVPNGEIFEAGDIISFEALALGPDNLSGTSDDGQIQEIKVLLNGKVVGHYSDYLTNDASGSTITYDDDTDAETISKGFLSYNFSIPQSTKGGEYKLEVIANGMTNLLSASDQRMIRVNPTRPGALILNSPLLGTEFIKDQTVYFDYTDADADINTTYFLQINGGSQWSATLDFNPSLLPRDGQNFSIYDGTGREPIVFEFDADGEPNATGSLERMRITDGSGIIEIEDEMGYTGLEDREYLLEIDSVGTGGLPDTFRWSINGGASFNDREIKITDGWHSLSAGISVALNKTGNRLGDTWVIRAKPARHMVAIAKEGSLSARIIQTKRNLITAINRARNESLLSIFAKDPNGVGVYNSQFPEELLSEHSIVIEHDGSYPVIEDVEVNVTDSSLSSKACMELIRASETPGPFSVELGGCLPLYSPLLNVRVVKVDSSGNRSYSRESNFIIRDPSRVKAVLNKLGNTYNPGRLSTLSIAALSENGNGEIAELEILDSGKGYNRAEYDSHDVKISSLSGKGGKVTLDIRGNVTENYIISDGGSGYNLSDIAVTSPPSVFSFGVPIALDAQALGPQSQLDRVAFYANGVEIDEPVQVIAGGYYRTIFTPKDPGNYFISTRPLYADSRDNGPSAPPQLLGFSRKPITQSFSTLFGWLPSWRHQHAQEMGAEFPSWYWAGSDYWDKSLHWRIRPDWAGAAPIKVLDPLEDRGEVELTLLESSLAIRSEILLDSQWTQVKALISRSSRNAPKISRAYLYGNEIELVELDVPDSNETDEIISFDWQVSYSQFQESDGKIEFFVLAEDFDGVRYYSNILGTEIEVMSADQPENLVGEIYENLTGESPSGEVTKELYDSAKQISDGSSDSNLTRAEITALVVDKVSQQIFNVVDLVAAYHIIYGQFFSNFTTYEEITTEWLPLFSENRSLALRQYIESEISSSKYKLIYGSDVEIDDPLLNPQILYGNRMKFITRHFKNKFARNPSAAQYKQALSKLDSSTFGGMKVDFIYQLAAEDLLPPFNQPFIHFTESFRGNIYHTVALMFSLYRENVDLDGGFNEAEARSLSNYSSKEIITKITSDDRFTERINLYNPESVDSSSEAGANRAGIAADQSRRNGSWKTVPWFGMIMDKQYPWIFHLDLGWMYSHGLNSNDIWFYSDSLTVNQEKIGWFWTNEQIFEGPASAGAGYENQRFIFIVKKLLDGSHVGSWALLDLKTGEAHPYGWVLLQK